VKTYILVAGIDYEFKGVDFRLFSDNRMKRIMLANKKKDDLTFMIFDFKKGEVFTNKVTYPGGKQTENKSTLSPSPFTPLTRANFDRFVVAGETHFKFKDGQHGTMSILDIYKAVQKIGTDSPNTLMELSFFSHAYMGGPILVNSFDDSTMNFLLGTGTIPFPLPANMRDPDDMDPRGTKDFIAPTMDATALTDFQNAFDPNGHIWIWGCAFPRLVHEILYKIEHNPSYKDSGLGDDVIFKITNFNNSQAELLERALLVELGGPFPDKKKIEIKFKFLKYFFCKVTVASYSHKIAEQSKVKTYGGVMGTYSEYDTGHLALMRVEPSFTRHFTFYKNYLGFNFDPEGRWYGEYKPTFTCAVPTP
jgi:hypothetical protein